MGARSAWTKRVRQSSGEEEVVGREEEGVGAPVVVGPAGEEDAAGNRSR